MFSYKAGSQFLNPVAVTPRHRVRRQAQQSPDFVQRMTLPNLQDYDFPLFRRQPFEAAHCGTFGLRNFIRPFKPLPGLKLTGNATPEAAVKVQGAIPETGQAIPLRRIRRFWQLQQGDKRVLHDVFRLRMAQSQRPAVEDQPGRLGGE